MWCVCVCIYICIYTSILYYFLFSAIPFLLLHCTTYWTLSHIWCSSTRGVMAISVFPLNNPFQSIVLCYIQTRNVVYSWFSHLFTAQTMQKIKNKRPKYIQQSTRKKYKEYIYFCWLILHPSVLLCHVILCFAYYCCCILSQLITFNLCVLCCVVLFCSVLYFSLLFYFQS